MMNENKLKNRLVQIRVSEQEEAMLFALCERFGSRSSEFIRGLIRSAHAKAFPAYTSKGKRAVVELQPELTPEQACELKGGKIVIREGVQMCALKRGPGMMGYVPLSKPELF